MPKKKTSPLMQFVKQPKGQLLLVALAVTLSAGFYMVFGASAAKPGSTSGGSGGCYVTPNPVAIGGNWTLTGTGLGAYTLVNVLITDASGGINSWNLQADANGVVTDTWHSYWSGTTNVKFNVTNHNKRTTIATCSFVVS